ncbi:MAG: Holliday junction branch migration protein RuvA [Caldilineaceae bacterium]|nr:Holliday junction branch migration protein RuvA [Caldilineaceae bacterium]
MIRQVRGAVTAIGKSFLVIDVGSAAGGVGLRVFVPEPTLARFRLESSVTLHTYLQVRESDLSLYGFENTEELAVFELLLGVSGVGPKVALAILSTLPPDTLRLAVANKQPAIVARAPGVGKRTAEKIVLELQGKLAGTSDDLSGLVSAMDADSEVIEALTALGYSVVQAQRAVQQIPADVTGVEDRLRIALSSFGE